MELDTVFLIYSSVLGLGVWTIFILIYLLHKRVGRIERLPSVKDFLKHAKSKKSK